MLTVDIHPATTAGKSILLVGNNISILHHITLGGTGKEVGNRHSKIGDGVLIDAGVTILGNMKIGVGSMVLIDVPARSTMIGNPTRLIGGNI